MSIELLYGGKVYRNYVHPLNICSEGQSKDFLWSVVPLQLRHIGWPCHSGTIVSLKLFMNDDLKSKEVHINNVIRVSHSTCSATVGFLSLTLSNEYDTFQSKILGCV